MNLEAEHQNEPENRIRLVIPDVVELASLTGDEIALEPITLGLAESTVEEMSTSDKGALGRAIWKYFGLTSGGGLKNQMIEEQIYDIQEGNVPGVVRERTYKTNIPSVLLHELLFQDGQKRFTVSVREET